METETQKHMSYRDFLNLMLATGVTLQQLIDVKKALDTGAMSQDEHDKEQQKILEKRI